jgi:hypothetical protein
MNRIPACIALGFTLAIALHSQAMAEADIEARHYSAQANAWVEGTLTKANSDGSFTVHGAESPYARDYASFMREYQSFQPSARDSHLQELMSSYGERLRYRWPGPEKQKDYTFTGGTGDVAIFEEPEYGRDASTWSYRAEPRAFQYDELKAGDRVVIGYDSFAENPFAIYLVNPSRSDVLNVGLGDQTHP